MSLLPCCPHHPKYLLNSDVLPCLLPLHQGHNVLLNLKHYQSNRDIAVLSNDWENFLQKQGLDGILFRIKYGQFCLVDDDKHAESWRELERDYLKYIEKPPSPSDWIISSIAVVYNLTLVTKNVINFKDFRDLTYESFC